MTSSLKLKCKNKVVVSADVTLGICVAQALQKRNYDVALLQPSRPTFPHTTEPPGGSTIYYYDCKVTDAEMVHCRHVQIVKPGEKLAGVIIAHSQLQPEEQANEALWQCIAMDSILNAFTPDLQQHGFIIVVRLGLVLSVPITSPKPHPFSPQELTRISRAQEQRWLDRWSPQPLCSSMVFISEHDTGHRAADAVIDVIDNLSQYRNTAV